MLIAKPLVKSVDQHRRLIDAVSRRKVLVAMEVHKRWDPTTLDARDGFGSWEISASFSPT